MNTNKFLILPVAIGLFLSGQVVAGEINTGYFGNIAIKGYDPVAYFTKRRALKGSKDLAYRWLDVDWYFSSNEHRQKFAENPVKYAPQYGGHCADGIASGVTVKYIDPNAWRIIGGKLYLFYDEDTAILHQKTEGRLEKSRSNWPALRADLLEDSD